MTLHPASSMFHLSSLREAQEIRLSRKKARRHSETTNLLVLFNITDAESLPI